MFTTKHISRINYQVSALILSGQQGNPRVVKSTVYSVEHAKIKKQTANPDLANKASKEDTRNKIIVKLDEELKEKMSGLSGDGGEAGIEYEDGKLVAMKRSVKNNIFRYI